MAYKQPLSRAQIAAIRGVNVDGVMRTLQQRGYIEEVARDPGPGQAVLFGTTREFLDRLGLDTIDDLPSVADLVPGADVVEALEQGLRAEPLTLPTADAETAAEDEPSDARWRRVPGRRRRPGRRARRHRGAGVDARAGAVGSGPSDVDEPDPSDAPSSTSVE